MRHKKKRHTLGRPADQRRALLRNMTTQILRYERIKTTESKAKAVKPQVEKMITLAKRGDLAARKQVSSYLLENRSGKAHVLKGKEFENIDETKQKVLTKDDKNKKARVRDKTVAQYLFEHIAPRYVDRQGGYVRIMKLLPRRGDGTAMALIELV